MDVRDELVLVGTGNRRVSIWDLRNMKSFLSERASKLPDYQSRCVKIFSDKKVCWCTVAFASLYYLPNCIVFSAIALCPWNNWRKSLDWLHQGRWQVSSNICLQATRWQARWCRTSCQLHMVLFSVSIIAVKNSTHFFIWFFSVFIISPHILWLERRINEC